jgi:hypothetical protein
MTFLIRTIDFTADGREIVREREVAGDTLSIGRAGENGLQLPDLSVEQRHATISPGPGGQLAIEADSGLGFVIEGRKSKSATINPREGAELAFGSYRLSIGQEGDGPVVVTVRQVEQGAGGAENATRFALATVLPSKRAMAWGALAVILLAFLAVPIWSHLNRPELKPEADKPGHVMWDKAWESGKLSLAHHGLENQCEACHTQPFVAVRDETCLTCHETTGDHAKMARLDVARGEPSGFSALLWKVAHTFNKPGPGACTDCHTEHEGPTRMEPPSQQFCADCHGTMDSRLADTALGNASDFGTAHPQLQAAVFTKLGQTDPVRIPLGGRPQEFNGLTFPHELHLDPRGGPARMAGNIGAKRGYGKALVCADCHHENKDRSGFVPVEMERDCEGCHSLVYDRVGSTFRTLRHGDVDQMRADLAAMDRTGRKPIASARRRPGQYGEGGLYRQNFGAPVQSYVGITRALSRYGVCTECHTPTTLNGRADVIPVNLQKSYFVHGRFDHEDHEQETCTSCHRADRSQSSSDLLLPEIKQCRTCHLGEDARQAEVPSSCAMCHSYHPRGRRLPQGHPPAGGDRVALTARRGG